MYPIGDIFWADISQTVGELLDFYGKLAGKYTIVPWIRHGMFSCGKIRCTEKTPFLNPKAVWDEQFNLRIHKFVLEFLWDQLVGKYTLFPTGMLWVM